MVWMCALMCEGIYCSIFGPEFERSHQGVLGKFFCDADAVGDSDNGGDVPCGLDLPNGLNRLRHIFYAC